SGMIFLSLNPRRKLIVLRLDIIHNSFCCFGLQLNDKMELELCLLFSNYPHRNYTTGICCRPSCRAVYMVGSMESDGFCDRLANESDEFGGIKAELKICDIFRMNPRKNGGIK
ncbi:MAG: hypothetical protein U0M21_01735, partial [Emergencia sp.]|nr:hypothetical protein [Emergencia sp.]